MVLDPGLAHGLKVVEDVQDHIDRTPEAEASHKRNSSEAQLHDADLPPLQHVDAAEHGVGVPPDVELPAETHVSESCKAGPHAARQCKRPRY